MFGVALLLGGRDTKSTSFDYSARLLVGVSPGLDGPALTNGQADIYESLKPSWRSGRAC